MNDGIIDTYNLNSSLMKLYSDILTVSMVKVSMVKSKICHCEL